MSSANTMSKSTKVRPVRISKQVSSRKSAFWNGLLEGFSGPLMMGGPVPGCIKYIKVTGKNPGTHQYTITLGSDTKITTLEVSSKSMANALSRAAALVMDSNNLVYQTVREKTLDEDGKFRTVERHDIVQKPSNEPRE
jgi:hypothetical protein